MSKKDGSIAAGIGWSFSERILAQSITFLVSVVLARLLLPEDYGVVSLVIVFISLANVFVVNGFGEALIQKKEADETDFSSIFWCTVTVSVVMYLIIFAFAPMLGRLYHNDIVVPVLQVLGLKIPLSSINTIQHAYISRNMQFKKFFFSTLGGTLVSGVVGIVMAICGCGVWAIVAQYIVNSSIDTIVLLFTVEWRPKPIFSMQSVKKMIGFAWKATGAAFINTLYIEVRSLIIGKVYTSADLAFYNRGNQIPSLLVTNLNAAINNVFFPYMSKLQDNLVELKALSRKTLRISSFCVFPILFGVIGVSRNLVVVLLTEKWLPCVPFLQILAVFWMTQPLQAINWQLMKAVGRSDLCLKLEIIKKIIGSILIIATMYISVEALAWSTMAFGIISMIINMLPNKKLVQYSMIEQIIDILPTFSASALMGVAVWVIDTVLPLNALPCLILQVILGAVLYLALSVLFHLEGLSYVRSFIGKLKKKSK